MIKNRLRTELKTYDNTSENFIEGIIAIMRDDEGYKALFTILSSGEKMSLEEIALTSSRVRHSLDAEAEMAAEGLERGKLAD